MLKQTDGKRYPCPDCAVYGFEWNRYPMVWVMPENVLWCPVCGTKLRITAYVYADEYGLTLSNEPSPELGEAFEFITERE